MCLNVKRLIKRTPLFIGVALVIAMLIFYNSNRASVYRELVTLDLIPRPETLTELYFNKSADLPSFVTRKQVIHFTFVIHNLEAVDYHYAYNVSVNAHGTRHIVDSGNVLVKDNQYYIKNENISLIDVPGTQDVVVELTNKRQSIDFWVET